MPREKREPIVGPKIKRAIAFMIETKADLPAAAAHAGISTYELRRSMGKPHVRGYALEQRQIAIESFVLGSPAALARVRDTSENGMAVVAAVKAGEFLKEGALAAEASAQRRQPGLSIVILPPVGSAGEPRVAFQPPPPMPAIDVTPVPGAEPVPVDTEGD